MASNQGREWVATMWPILTGLSLVAAAFGAFSWRLNAAEAKAQEAALESRQASDGWKTVDSKVDVLKATLDAKVDVIKAILEERLPRAALPGVAAPAGPGR